MSDFFENTALEQLRQARGQIPWVRDESMDGCKYPHWVKEEGRRKLCKCCYPKTCKGQ